MAQKGYISKVDCTKMLPMNLTLLGVLFVTSCPASAKEWLLLKSRSVSKGLHRRIGGKTSTVFTLGCRGTSWNGFFARKIDIRVVGEDSPKMFMTDIAATPDLNKYLHNTT